MKLAVVFAALALASVAQAGAPKLGDVFKGVTYAQPKCFGREYSRAELKAHPKQTVEQIKAKLIKYSADTSMPSAGLKIEVRLKGEEGVNYHAEFSCMDYQGKAFCGIECDGGSVTIAEFDGQKMTLNSEGFNIHGGCGEEGVTKFLEAIKGGDDIFKMQALPQSYCTDASAVYDQSSN